MTLKEEDEIGTVVNLEFISGMILGIIFLGFIATLLGLVIKCVHMLLTGG